MTKWQFNILFFVGVGGAVFLLIGPYLGIDVNTNPTALAGIGSILAYILTQKSTLTKKDPKKIPPQQDPDEGDDAASDNGTDSKETVEDDG